MKEHSRRERRDDRKLREKKFLDQYKDEAPKGPGFSWKAKIIFATIGLLFILGFVFGKSLYVGSTPIKLLDYSLTRSMKTSGRDFDLNIQYDAKDDQKDYEFHSNIQFTFEYLKSLISIEGDHLPSQKVFINTDSIQVNSDDQWKKYSFDQLVIKDQSNLSWLPLEQVLDIRSIPAVEDVLEEYAQYFITAYYNRFEYGQAKEIQTKDDLYKSKKIDVIITEEDFYPLIRDFIGFNDNMIDFRQGVKDRVKRFLEAVQENDLYDRFDLDEATVENYLNNFEENYEITYILFIAYLEEEVNKLEDVFSQLDAELHLSFYIDKDYLVRAIDAKYINLDNQTDLNSVTINYVVNNYKQGYVENPLEFEEPHSTEEVYIEDLIGKKHPITVVLNSIYDYIFK